ncbi:MAG: hypothetical protein IKD25_02880 [Bacteroidaceae bacterium]|nr:hypothetical protein [Bacteroidaceae bacterium]
MVSLLISYDDGTTKPFCHRLLVCEGVVIDNKMIKEFYNMIDVELFFVDVNF